MLAAAMRGTTKGFAPAPPGVNTPFLSPQVAPHSAQPLLSLSGRGNTDPFTDE